MEITITCYARFRDAFGEEQILTLPEGATISDAVQQLARTGDPAELLIDEEGSIRSYVMIMYRSERISIKDAETLVLSNGDNLTLFPPVSGG
ncbi:MAG: MoaD/ThiS family protein [Methanospirillum sp.]|nr:MoaD/ThiS family protein [Methanospirillum sp.]